LATIHGLGSARFGERHAAIIAPLQIAPPILEDKHHAEPSAFTPENLLREARRQKGLPIAKVPGVCVLDPDADIVRELLQVGRARPDPSWACYHTDLYVVRDGDSAYGIIGGAVGASFAVLVAEELFASGCEYLLSITSAGQIAPLGSPPYFILIDRALRDEGTSYHYLPPARYAEADPNLVDAAQGALADVNVAVVRGSTWTTEPHSARQRRPSPRVKPRAFSLSRWRPPLCMRLPSLVAGRSSASPTSRTRWVGKMATSRRGRPTAPAMPFGSSRRLWASRARSGNRRHRVDGYALSRLHFR